MHTTALPNDARIAVIGGGPAGIATAKELAERGFSVARPRAIRRPRRPVAHRRRALRRLARHAGEHERRDDALLRPPRARAWPMFPSAEQVARRAARLRRVVRRRAPDAVRRARPLRPRRTARAGPSTCRTSPPGRIDTVRADAVVAASGRFAVPADPRRSCGFGPGVDVIHSQRVPPAGSASRAGGSSSLGNSISGLEIAADLALDPSIDGRLLVAPRRAGSSPRSPRACPPDQRAVHGVRRAARPLAAARGARGRRCARSSSRRRATRRPSAGSPRTPTSWPPGLSQSQHYLPLVAEGRIAARPGIAGVAGDVVRFTDGTEATVDAVVLATGYAPELPYLAGQPSRSTR